MVWINLDLPIDFIFFPFTFDDTMKRISYTLFHIFALMLSFMPLASAQPTSTLRVMTYNIRLDVESDGPDAWIHRKEALASLIQAEQADFIGVQEALYHQVHYLDSVLNQYQYIGVGRDDGKKEGEFMALFYKTNDWKVSNANTFWLSPTPDSCSMGWDAACKRVCTWGNFTNLHTGKEITIYNTHLDHMGQQARAGSIDLLLSRISSQPKGRPLVLMGDFNMTPSGPWYEHTSASLKDARVMADLVLESFSGTFNGFEKGEYRAPFNQRIDYVFCRNIDGVTEYKVPVPLTENGRHVSDHFPLIVTLVVD